MKEIDRRRAVEKETGVKRRTLEDIERDAMKDANDDVANILALHPTVEDVIPGQVVTDGRASISLTSTLTACHTSNATRQATADEIREAKWRIMRQV